MVVGNHGFALLSARFFRLFCFTLRLECVTRWATIVLGFGKPKNPEEHRYYLLPGMGKANRRKHALHFKWAIVVGIIISLVIGLVIYIAQRPGPALLP